MRCRLALIETGHSPGLCPQEKITGSRSDAPAGQPVEAHLLLARSFNRPMAASTMASPPPLCTLEFTVS